MKKMRKIIPALAMLLVSAVMMSTASFAWFSMSTKATATGMEVKATASSSLIITDNPILANFVAATQTVDLSGQNLASALIPATHIASGDTGYSNGLKTLTNTGDVNAANGATPAAPTWGTTTKGQHYVEYVAYLATSGTTALSNQTITATVSIAADIEAKYEIHNAVTVDFWVATVTDDAAGTEAYKEGATVNLKTVDANANKSSVVIAEGITIPVAVVEQAATGDYLKVFMRVYFDGSLMKDATNAYVRNAMVTEVAAAFSVEFSAA